MVADRLAYPAGHVEVDNRLTWFLGRLHDTYGDEASYVHLTRDREATAKSLARRYPVGIIKAYRDEFFVHAPQPDLLDLGLDFVDTANANIRAFLRDKSRTLHVQMETMADGIADVWDWAAVEGDLDAARAECGVRYNTAEDLEKWQAASAAEVARQNGAPTLTRAMRKVQRIAQKLPEFVRSA